MEYIVNKEIGLFTPKLQRKNNDYLEESVKSMNRSQKVFIVGLCGGQGGGKTKLSKVLSKNIPGSAIIEERNFFKPLTIKRKLSAGDEPLVGEFGGYSKDRKLLLVEFSNPNSYDYDKLYNTLKKLIDGNPVQIRKFDEEQGVYTGEEIEINPETVSLVIVEGYFLFKNRKVRDLINLKIYSEIDDDVRLSRLLINENKFIGGKHMGDKILILPDIHARPFWKKAVKENVDKFRTNFNLLFISAILKVIILNFMKLLFISPVVTITLTLPTQWTH